MAGAAQAPPARVRRIAARTDGWRSPWAPPQAARPLRPLRAGAAEADPRMGGRKGTAPTSFPKIVDPGRFCNSTMEKPADTDTLPGLSGSPINGPNLPGGPTVNAAWLLS